MIAKWAWHIHHTRLAEPLTEPLKTRIAYIKEHKPKSEQALRLRLLKQVKGPLPAALLKADAAWQKADAARQKAYASRQKAYAAALPELEALHKQECPNCPWDGRTIFPKEKR